MRVRTANSAPPPRPPQTSQTERVVQIKHDLINEQVLIVAAASDPQARARLVRRAKPEDFMGQGHAELWRALLELDRQSLDFSPAALRQVTGGSIDDGYITQLLSRYQQVPPNLNYHLDALAWDKVRIEASQGPIANLLKLVKDATAPPDVVRSAARQVAQAFEAAGGQLRYLLDPNELVRQQHADVAARRQGRARHVYGIEGLDDDLADPDNPVPRMIPAAAPGQVTVVTGVPGSGKTTFLARIALAQAKLGKRTLYGAWEIQGGPTLELLAAMGMGLSRTRLMSGRITDGEHAALLEWMEWVAGFVRFMANPFGRKPNEKPSNDRNLDLIHQYMSDAGCDIAIFDLWKRCLRFADPDDEEQALYRQQSIAQETSMHVLLAHQQRHKDIANRTDKRPTAEGAKGSGSYFEICDTMIGTHRPALWKRVPDETFEGIILKQRWGAFPLAVEFDWNAEFGRIQNGRSIPYDPPGANEGDPIADFAEPQQKGRRRS